jgi:hypothetical protein
MVGGASLQIVPVELNLYRRKVVIQVRVAEIEAAALGMSQQIRMAEWMPELRCILDLNIN